MKAVIAQCISAMIKEKFGKDKHEAVLDRAGFNKFTIFVASQDMEDSKIRGLIDAACELLGISQQQAAEAFGEYWICHFAPKIYGYFYQNVHDVRGFLEKLNDIHESMTRNLINARPPHFSFEETGPDTLIMHYQSDRAWVDILMGLTKGLGKRFGEDLEVEKLSESRIQIHFKH